MTIINPLPDTLTNGTTADATQVMANLSQIVANTNANAAHNGANSDITSLSACTQITGMTTPLTVPQGGTGVATLTSAAPVVGSGASALTTGLTTVTNTLGGNVSINNASNYFDGPSCAQGTTGTWLAIGQVTVTDSSDSTWLFKLWDGTTVMASGTAAPFNTSARPTTLTFSGILANPAGNIRISVKTGTTTGTILFNSSGNSKDSTLTVIRIA